MLADKFDTRFSAEAAARGDRSEALGRRRYELHSRRELDVDYVAERRRQRARRDRLQIGARAHNSLGKKKTGGKFLIVARRPHRHGNGMSIDPDFERLLDSHLVGHVFVAAILFPANDAAGTDALAFCVRAVHAG